LPLWAALVPAVLAERCSVYRLDHDLKQLMRLGVATAALAGVLAVVAAVEHPRWAVASAVSSFASALFSYLAWHLSSFRRITPGERAGLLRTLAQLPPVAIRVSAVPTTEARAYARQILDVLREAKWPARGVYRTKPGILDARGLFVAVPSDERASRAAQWLLSAFERVGIQVERVEEPSLKPDKVELLVGRPPAA
jgi:hypothetical protein